MFGNSSRKDETLERLMGLDRVWRHHLVPDSRPAAILRVF
jgi:hypothetical protein